MIKSITVINETGDLLKLELRNPGNTGFFVRGVDGLGPVKTNINFTEPATIDGGIFNSARTSYRNIVLRLGFMENPTIEDSRQNSYKFFPIKSIINLLIETDNFTLRTVGHVESNDIEIFSKEEGCVISVLCPSAYFHATIDSIVNFSSISKLFSFPFSNESLTEKLIVFGALDLDFKKTITYLGNVENGITLNVHVLGPVTNLRIYNLTSGQMMKIDSDILLELTGEGLHSGDDIVITTTKGAKTVSLKRDGVTSNILNALGSDSEWFTIKKGDNTFYYTADSGAGNLQFSISYRTLYLGV